MCYTMVSCHSLRPDPSKVWRRRASRPRAISYLVSSRTRTHRVASFRRFTGPDMKILTGDELRVAEKVLQQLQPRSLKAYGYLHAINRNVPTTLEVLVDAWPDFKVILFRPDPANERALGLKKKVIYFTADDDALRRALTEENAIDWSTTFRMAGFDKSHTPMIKEIASQREINSRMCASTHLMYLPHSSHLVTPEVDSEFESRISSLNLSHADLVNKTWKFGGDEKGYRNITNLISNFPSCCITDAQGQPLSWILAYDYCAMGILYTRPEHRMKGYAKAVVGAMAKRLLSEGYPVFCYIEEENEVSYTLFKKMGFIEDPAYRAAWMELNF